MDKRYYVNNNVTIDLEDVSAVLVTGSYAWADPVRYVYEVALKSGVKVTFEGVGLNSQYKKYKGITENETVQHRNSPTI